MTLRITMKSRERSTVESQIKTEDKTTSTRGETAEKEEIPTAETIESSPSSLTIESIKNEDTNELKDHLETSSTLLTNIGNRQSKYLQDLIELQEDMYDSCDRIIQSQLTQFYSYLPEKFIDEWYIYPFSDMARKSVKLYLNLISIGYDYALVRTKIYKQIMQASKNLLPGHYRFYKIATNDSQPGE